LNGTVVNWPSPKQLLFIFFSLVTVLLLIRGARRGKPFPCVSSSLSFCGLQKTAKATMAEQSNGEVLMLEAPPSYGKPTSSDAEIIDALPYIDDDYADPRVKLEVDRLVEDEMRRSSKKPTDFLKDFPPLPSSNFEVLLFSIHFIFWMFKMK